jgi:hypothetical protein
MYVNPFGTSIMDFRGTCRLSEVNFVKEENMAGITGQDGGPSGTTPGQTTGVWGDSGPGIGVYGSSNVGTGVMGSSSASYGVVGYSVNSSGVFGESNSGDGVHGISDGAGNGVFGRSDGGGFAGYFEGQATVTQLLSVGSLACGGNINKQGSCNFKIDHPLDPANKYLYHSAVESPERKNVYDGVAVLDSKGEAVVELPPWFEALNGQFRYQLTPIGAAAPKLHIARELRQNRFKIAGGKRRMKVSWQLTGIRHDAYARAYPPCVEEEKPEEERGYYAHPALYGEPPERGIEWAHRIARERIREAVEARRPAATPLTQAPDSAREATHT